MALICRFDRKVRPQKETGVILLSIPRKFHHLFKEDQKVHVVITTPEVTQSVLKKEGAKCSKENLK